MHKKYPGHNNAFINADIYPKMCPSLKELWIKADTSILTSYTKQENRCMVEHNAYLCVGFSNTQRVNIQIIIKKLLPVYGIL